MQARMKPLAVTIAALVAGGGFSALTVAPAIAQTTTGGQPIRIEVTGSNIPRTSTETASPVQVLTREDLDRSGYTSINEVLRDITANSQGLLSQNFSRAFAGGAAGVALRGLSVGATLVLIDGFRMAPYPLADDNQRGFVDISNIPFSAIERVEVLLDGASAIYGSDAIGGVVNIILKKRFTGTQVTAQAGTTSEGDGNTVHASLTSGFGDSGPYNGFVTFEYRQQDQILLKDRGGDWANFDWRGQGGGDLRAGALAPTITTPFVMDAPYLTRPGGSVANAATYSFLNSNCDFTRLRASQCLYTDDWSQIQPETRNFNVVGAFNAQLRDGWQLSLTGSYFWSEAQQVFIHNVVPASSFAGVVGFGPGSPPSIYNAVASPGFNVPASYPGNTLGVPATVRAILSGPGQYDYESGTTRIVAELTGAWAGWDLNFAGGYTQVRTTGDYTGGYDVQALRAALTDPTNRFYPFLLPGTGTNSAAAMAAIQPVVSKVATNELDFFQATATRDLMKLDGGPLGLALGASYVHQDLNGDNYGEPCALGTVAGPNCMYAVGIQNNTAVFAEINAPVLKNLELNAAVRYDYYDTYGGKWTPKFGAKWTPIKELALRGTWGQGFRAPYMTENGDAAFRFGFNTLRDPVLCPVSDASGDPVLTSPQNVPAQCNFAVAYVQGTTPDLEPEESTNWTVGFVLEPVQDLSITADYYEIEVKNQIVSDSSLADFDALSHAYRGIPQLVTYGDGSQGISAVGPIAYVAAGYVNAQKVTTTGLDLGATYSFKLPDASRAKLGVQWSHIFKYDIEFAGAKYKLAGTHGPSDVSGNTGNPQDRLQLTGQWMKGPFTATLIGNMVGSYDMTDPKAGVFDCETGMNYWNGQRWADNPSGFPSDLCKIDAFWYWNLNLQWQYSKQMMFQLSVINMFNQEPPVDAGAYAGTGVNRTSNQTGIPLNPSLHSVGAVGTSFLLGLTYNF